MKKNLFSIYVLLVCLICLITSIGFLGALLYNTMGTMLPRYTISSYDYNNLISNESFVESLRSGDPCYGNKEIKCRPIPDKDEEITALRERKLGETIAIQKHTHVQSIIETLPYLILFLLVGLLHWRLFKSIKETAGSL